MIKNEYKALKMIRLSINSYLNFWNIHFKVKNLLDLYSITEDYFEQDVNSVFCKNSEFIEDW
jgi:hypothetical protein